MKIPERQTKIIATIGPATESDSMLESLIMEGVDVMRLNMAHATHDWIRDISKRIRTIGRRLKREPAILMDVKGPEIRTGFLQNPIDLIRGDMIDLVFTSQPEPP
ncbi:MAG: pyruvate kinase, partial [Opitutae bacterium]